MAAGEGFKEWQTGDVLTANDVNGYLNQGIWVFDDAADRTAQVTSPQEGNFAYLRDDNKLYYYTGSAWAEADTSGIQPSEFAAKGDLLAGTGASTFDNLSVGTNGHVLTADSTETTGMKWAPVAGASARSYNLINTGGTSLGGSTTTITGISGKDSLMILISGLSLNNSQDIGQRLRFNTDSGSNYAYMVVGRNNSNVTSESFTSTGGIFLGVPNDDGSTADCIIWVDGCNGSGNKVLSYTFSGNASGSFAKYFNGHGRWTGSASVTSISIITDSNNYDAGTVFVYGA
jgi:hypothetical protein